MVDSEIVQLIAAAVRSVRESNQLAGSVTNGVTMDFVANAQLAVGGSAAMVYLPDEAEFLIEASGAFYINMGTLMPIYEQTIPAATKKAAELNKPWVLDPVGIGIGSLRTKLLSDMAGCKPSIIRGNASEIMALADLWGLLDDSSARGNVRGVDATDSVSSAAEAAVALARWTRGAVAVSGEEDLVSDGQLIARSYGGSSLMEKVTGFGCSLGGVMAVYAASASPFIAALASVALYNLAGLRAAQKASTPASFKAAFIDELFSAEAEDVAGSQFRIERCDA
ncbi:MULTISPECIES: hydroxyethylthiazole kinase [unclassified Adlercreutzia]|uniref:hydroxyethylthiazole kinase n=1 Tax=unclassified Adlercreutzia TaxID=2636013 RepID=UPI0013EB5D96|nr:MULTISPECIES: hydroxyethylthiazole kinase [unclassified Adlercreutzia]